MNWVTYQTNCIFGGHSNFLGLFCCLLLFRQSTGNKVSDHYFCHYSPQLSFFSPPSSTFFIRMSVWIEKHFLEKFMGAPPKKGWPLLGALVLQAVWSAELQAVWDCRQFDISGGSVLKAVQRSRWFGIKRSSALQVVQHCRQFSVAGASALQRCRQCSIAGSAVLQAVQLCRQFSVAGALALQEAQRCS